MLCVCGPPHSLSLWLWSRPNRVRTDQPRPLQESLRPRPPTAPAGDPGALTGPQASTDPEYNLSQLAGTGQTRPGFTQVDLISNVTDEPSWDNEYALRPPVTALANLDNPESMFASNPNLLLPGAGIEAVSPSHQSLSTVLGMGVRGASPMSPIDSLMPSLTSLNTSQTYLVGSPTNTLSSLRQRSLNSMQITQYNNVFKLVIKCFYIIINTFFTDIVGHGNS